MIGNQAGINSNRQGDILCVGQEKTLLENIVDKVKQLGYRPISLLDIQENPQTLRKNEPQIVLFIVRGFEVWAVELLRMYQSDLKNELTPILVIGSVLDSSVAVTYTEAGADDYVCHSVDNQILAAKLQSLLRWQRQNYTNQCTILKLQLETEKLKNENKALQRNQESQYERYKELNAYYELSNLIDSANFNLERVLTEAVRIIPTALRFPDIACVRIAIRGHHIQSNNFRQTRWGQKADIIVKDLQQGSIEVYYLEFPPIADDGIFYTEEDKLLKAIAAKIGQLLERLDQSEKLRESEKRLQLMIEGSRDAPWDWDLLKDEMYYSPQWWRQLGYEPGEMVADSQLWKRLLHPDDLGKVERVFSRALRKTPISYAVEMRLKHKQGFYIPILSRGYVSANDQGHPIRVSGTNFDLTRQKKIAKKMRQSRNHFQSILKASKDGFCIIDLHGRFTYSNAVFCNIIGYSPQQLSLMFLADIEVNENEKQIEEHIRRIIDNGHDQFETKHRCQDGTVLDVQVSAQYQENDSGRLVCFFRDISQSKQRERVLQARLCILEAAAIGSVPKLLQSAIQECEKISESKIGFFHFVDSDEKSLFLQAWSPNTITMMCRASASPQHYPIDQAGVWVDCVLQRKPVIHNDYLSLNHRKGLPKGHAEIIRELLIPIFRQEKIVAILGVGNRETAYTQSHVTDIATLADMAWDISERLIAQQALRESELRIRTIGDNLPDGLIFQFLLTKDGQKRFTYISAKVAMLHGCSVEEAMEDPSRILRNIVKEDRLIIIRAFKKTITESGVYDATVRMRHNSNQIRWHRFIAKLRQLDEGLVLDGINLDITKQKHNEIAMQVAKRKSEESDKLKSSFLANMSHEIRTPLYSITGYTEILMSLNTSQEISEYLAVIKNSGDLLLCLINDILDLSKIEANQQEILFIPMSLKSIIDNTHAFGLSLLTKGNTDLGINKHLPLEMHSTILGDPIRIQQVLNNLLSNAIKFTESGRVDFGVELVSAQSINNSEQEKKSLIDKLSNTTGEYLKFYVKDSGIGIAQNKIDGIFLPFRQIFTEMSLKFQGTGLGLAICKRLVELMGGQIWCQSTPGKGSCFYFTLPYHPVSENTIAKKSTVLSLRPIKSDVKILIADDNIVNIKITEKYLQFAGYNVITAVNGQQVISLFNSDKDISLILMDLQMPLLDGLEATRLIRNQEKQTMAAMRIPIIALTAAAMVGDEERCLAAGCDGYLTKPIEQAKLLEMLHLFIRPS